MCEVTGGRKSEKRSHIEVTTCVPDHLASVNHVETFSYLLLTYYNSRFSSPTLSLRLSQRSDRSPSQPWGVVRTERSPDTTQTDPVRRTLLSVDTRSSLSKVTVRVWRTDWLSRCTIRDLHLTWPQTPLISGEPMSTGHKPMDGTPLLTKEGPHIWVSDRCLYICVCGLMTKRNPHVTRMNYNMFDHWSNGILFRVLHLTF